MVTNYLDCADHRIKYLTGLLHVHGPPHQISQLMYKRLDLFTVKFNFQKFKSNSRGKGRVPKVHIMKNELEHLSDGKGHDSNLAKKFLKDIILSPSYRGHRVTIWLSLLGNS